MAASRPIRAPVVALATLSAATAVALTRVFAGHSWLGAALGCVALAYGVGALADRHKWSGWTTLGAHLALSCAVTTAIVEVNTTAAGLPTRTALGDWLHDLSRAGKVLRGAVVPVPPHGAALLLALLSIWAVAGASHWSAARLDGTLGAMVPNLALFIAIGALGKGAIGATTALWSLCAAVFLLALHMSRLTEQRTWFHTRAPARSRLVAGGSIAALAAVTAGAIVGPNLPSARGAPLLNYRRFGVGHNGNGTIPAISPLVDIGARLTEQPPTELFVVSADREARWRQVALDNFDGKQWTLSATTSTDLPEATEGITAVRLVQHYRVGPLAGNFLPAAYRAVGSVDGVSGLRTVRESATLLVADENHQGLAYTLTSLLPAPTIAQLRASPRVALGSAPGFSRELYLPTTFPQRVRELAATVTADVTDPYDKALAIQNYLRGPGFTYDLSARLGESSSAIEDFLFVKRRGFCEQFAGAFGAMARAVGLPTRLAVGFQPGVLRDDGFHVTTDQAHAWPEVYFANIGWIAFEPTPGRFDTSSPGDVNQTGSQAPSRPTTSTTTPAVTTTPGTGTLPDRLRLPPGERRGGLDPGVKASESASRSAATTVAVVVGVIALGAVTMALVIAGAISVGKWARRRRRRLAPNARERVEGAWSEVVERLAECDIVRRPAATPVEFAMRDAPARGAGVAGVPLIELAQLHTAAVFAAEEPADEDATRAWECVVEIETALHDRDLPGPGIWRRLRPTARRYAAVR